MPFYILFLAGFRAIEFVYSCWKDENVDIDNSVIIFQNPFNGVFALQVKGSEATILEIYNAIGEKVYETQINSTQSHIDLKPIQRVFILQK